ncbi:MAG TPA: PPOX class F420-dependent oxidoreductase [Acidimicrobiales bacterium]|nr:PPOX class F420-dependent oxidoreductase [Acidimicrobiales bacterium]
MDIEEATAFMREHHRSVLHTTRDDGSPQLSPVVHAVDDGGRVMVSSRETAMKVRNLRRRPRATLLALSDNFFGPWAQVSGSVEIESMPGALEGLKAYYRQISGEHPDWQEYEEAMAREQRVLLTVTIDQAGPRRSG